MFTYDVAIIGAGISGLAAYRSLHNHQKTVCLFEKSRGLGGRTSTRRGENWLADLGAQFFAPKHPLWESLVKAHPNDFNEVPVTGDFLPRLVHRQGMSKLGRLILPEESAAGSPTLHLNSRVVGIDLIPDESKWRVRLDSGITHHARALILTAPVPQALELLQQSGLKMKAEAHESLVSVRYVSCLAQVVAINAKAAKSLSSHPAIWKDPSESLSGIFDQARKGLSTGRATVVLHTSPNYSQTIWQLPAEQISVEISKRFCELFPNLSDGDFETLHLHRWRYCEPQTVLAADCMSLPLESSAPPLILAGDGFGRSSVDGALTSGFAAAEFLRDDL